MEDIVLKIAGIILAEKDGKYLLVKENWGSCVGLWSLPGGGQENKEDIFACAVREGQEETGFIFSLRAIVGFYQQYLCRTKEDIFGVVFKAEIVGGKETLSDEISEIGYFSNPEIREMAEKGLLRFPLLRIIEDSETGREFPLSCVTVFPG
jgi:8-oxo-dGTP diphosphatase